jgi:predicted RNase H-like HicB family nuclease
MRFTHIVNARRAGSWWAIDVAGLDGVFSQARRLDQVEAMAREAIALYLNVPSDSFEVEIRTTLEPAVSELITKATAAKRRAAAAQAEASNFQHQAARVLVDGGLTIRDAGKLLDVSHQRIAQLLESRPENPTPAAVADVIGDDDQRVDGYGASTERQASTAPTAVADLQEVLEASVGAARKAQLANRERVRRKKTA